MSDDAKTLERALSAWQTGGDLVVSQDRPFGMGNSPPATNVADSPEMAVSVGCARVRITPARSMARSVAVMLLDVPVRKLLDRSCPLAENGLALLKFTTAEP